MHILGVGLRAYCFISETWDSKTAKAGKMPTLQTMNPQLKAYLASIGRRGGQKSRRKLSTEQAQAMVKAREAKRTGRQFEIEQTPQEMGWVDSQGRP